MFIMADPPAHMDPVWMASISYLAEQPIFQAIHVFGSECFPLDDYCEPAIFLHHN